MTDAEKKTSAGGPAGSSLWPVTDWSGVRQAAGAVGTDPERLNALIVRYQAPLKVFLLSGFPSLKNQVEEFLQEFAEDKFLREGWLGKANRERGRFRDFLKSSLRNFLKDRLRKQANQPASLDEMELELAAEAPDDTVFDLNWARAILAETLQRMEEDCRAPAKDQPRRAHIWEIFRLRLLQPALEGAEPVGYETLVGQLGIVSPFDAQNMLATAKRIFSRHLEAVISEYEQGGEAVKKEIEELKRFLGGLSKRKKR
jgi:DNA-directed RNA polymerase specialized sigma24 family protein